MLLVLDNFEHVLDAAAAVAELIRVSPRSRFVVTSRAPLRVTGEHEMPMAPLGVRGEDSAARRLFVERARAVRPSWDPGPDGEVVDEICALVDGLPLGIELAAARVSLLPLAAIRDRLAARLPLPGSGARDVPARQRTLEGAVAWSHDLLSPRLQRAFDRLSVFEGSFDADQAGPVMADPDEGSPGASLDPLDDLAELAGQSLIERFPADAGVRFRMLQTIQAVAAQGLAADGDEADTRRRHAESFLALALAAQEHESTHDRAVWINRLAADDANIRSAVHWAIDSGEAALALRLVAAVWRYWQVDGHLTEGRELAERAIAMPAAQGRTTERMWAIAAAGSLAYWQADTEHARGRYEEQLELARALDHEAGVVDAIYNIGHAQFIEERDPAVVLAAVDDVRQRYRDLGDERGVARADWALANAMLDAGMTEESCATLERILIRFEELDDAQYHAMAAGSLAWANFRLGHQDEAVRWAVRGIRETYAQRDFGSTAITLTTAVLVAVIVGRFDVAARLAGAFEAASERYGIRPPAALDRFIGDMNPIGIAREALSQERWDMEFEAGRRLWLGQAVDLLSEIAAPPPAGRD